MRLNSNAALATACLILAIALPALAAYYLATASAPELAGSMGLLASSPLNAPGFQLSVLQRAIVILLGLLPVTFMAASLVFARRSFRSFERHEYFTLEVVRGLRSFAAAIFFSGISGLFVAPLASVLLSMTNHETHRSLSLSIGSSQTLLILFAGIVWQIATVMGKAVALAEENSQFV
jgi:hypothetical protein